MKMDKAAFDQLVAEYHEKNDELQNLDRQLAAQKAMQEKRDALAKEMDGLRARMAGEVSPPVRGEPSK